MIVANIPVVRLKTNKLEFIAHVTELGEIVFSDVVDFVIPDVVDFVIPDVVDFIITDVVTDIVESVFIDVVGVVIKGVGEFVLIEVDKVGFSDVVEVVVRDVVEVVITGEVVISKAPKLFKHLSFVKSLTRVGQFLLNVMCCPETDIVGFCCDSIHEPNMFMSELAVLFPSESEYFKLVLKYTLVPDPL